MAVTALNRFRWGMLLRSRAYKSLFHGGDGRISRSGEHVLADLRHFCFADRGTIFDNNPQVMARREGRREVFVRFVNLLNLDEEQVQKLMELDDGI